MSEAPPKHLETVLDMSKLNFFNASHGSSYSASSIVDFALNQCLKRAAPALLYWYQMFNPR